MQFIAERGIAQNLKEIDQVVVDVVLDPDRGRRLREENGATPAENLGIDTVWRKIARNGFGQT